MACLLLSADLFFSSRVYGAGQAAGLPVATVGNAPRLLELIEQAATGGEPVRLVLLDLTSPPCDVSQLVPAIRAAAEGVEILAFGPHVQGARLEAARAAGCDAVLTRGQFDRELASILSRHA